MAAFAKSRLLLMTTRELIMQSQEDTRLDQQAPEEAATAVADPAPRKPGRPKGSKNAAKKKTSKKKIGKKKASKKKAATKAVAVTDSSTKALRNKAVKKKVSKKKRSTKKTAAGGAGGSDSMARLMAAVEEMREAIVELAQSKAGEQQTAVNELRQAAKAKIADLEEVAVRSLKKLGL